MTWLRSCFRLFSARLPPAATLTLFPPLLAVQVGTAELPENTHVLMVKLFLDIRYTTSLAFAGYHPHARLEEEENMWAQSWCVTRVCVYNFIPCS